MSIRSRCLAPLFAFALPCVAIAQDVHGDEARIEALLRAERNAGVVHAPSAPGKPNALRSHASEAAEAPRVPVSPQPQPVAPSELGFDDLRKMRGKVVRIVAVGGGVRVGTIEAADRQKVTLNVRMGGGYARYDLARDRVQSVALVQR